MNALVLSPIWGVIMMFSGIFLKRTETVRAVAITGMSVLLLVTILEIEGTTLFKFDVSSMLVFDNFALLFNAVAFSGVLLFFLLSGRDINNVGLDVADYY